MTTFLNIALLSCVAIGALTDLFTKKIYNLLTLPLALFGLAFHAYTTGLSGAAFALSGLGAGLLIYLPLCMGGIMGAGDAKLLGAIGAVAGWRMAVNIGFYALIIGGLIALFILFVMRRFSPWLSDMKRFLISFLVPGCDLQLPHLQQCHWMPYGPALLLALIGMQGEILIPLL